MSAESAPAVLHITAAPGGGVDRHVRDLVASTSPRHLIWHLGSGIDVIEDVADHRFLPLHDIAADGSAGAALAQWLRDFGVGIAHVHGVTDACRDRLAMLEALLALPYIVTLHDLLFVNRRAFETPGMPEVEPEWVATIAGMLLRASAVIAPSDFIRDVAIRCVPGLRVTVIPQGIRVVPLAHVPGAPADFIAGAPEHIVAVVGAVGPHKGSALLDALAAALVGSDIGLVVIGYTDTRLEQGWVVPGHYFVHGPYVDAMLPGWLAAYRAEIVLFPNRLPESFSYTLSEVWAAGLPVVVPDDGALGERVARHGGGWRLPSGYGTDDAAQLLSRLLSAEGAAERARVKSQVSPLDAERTPTFDAMSRDYDALYARFALPPPETTPDAAAAHSALEPLLAANLDGFAFRQELVKLAGELHEAQVWPAKLQRDIATLNAELTRCVEENRVLSDQKSAFDILPEAVRRFLLRKALRARR